MKRFLPYTIAAALIFAGCSNHIEDLKVPEEPTSEIDVDVEIDFRSLILGYDSAKSIATVTGLEEGAEYSWSIDGKENAEVLKTNGATCTLNIKQLSIGNHTLLVVGTLNGVQYTAECKITLTEKEEEQ